MIAQSNLRFSSKFAGIQKVFNRLCVLLFWLRIEADYSTELLMAMLRDNTSLVANSPSIAVTPVNE